MTADERAYWCIVREDLKAFLHRAFLTIYPGQVLMDNWHIDSIIGALEDCISGVQPRLILNLPPRHLKSHIVSSVLPAFLFGRDPSVKIICTSYSDDLARTLGRDFRRIVQSAWFRDLFPATRLTKVTENEVVTDRGGYRVAASVGGTLTGRGADFIIIDDPLKPEDALSDRAREAVNEWFRSTLLSRLDDKARSALILVAQRLHVNDLTGYLEAGGGFRKLSFPAIATENEVIPLRFGREHWRKVGEPLQVAREGRALLDSIRDQVGSFNFSAQYQQRPSVPDGSMFLRRWFDVINRGPRLSDQGQLMLSLDTAASTASTADYTALTLVYKLNTEFYVMKAQRARWTYEQQKDAVSRYVKAFGCRDSPLAVIFEYASTGISLYQHFSDVNDGRMRTFGYQPKQNKLGRAASALPTIEQGRVHLVRYADRDEWIEPFLDEFTTFPYGRFDDWVDSLSQLLCWAKNRGPMGPGFMEIF